MKKALAGSYEGRWHVRKGREEDLTATERKRFLKSSEVFPLVLSADGSFTSKGSTHGTWEPVDTLIEFKPISIDGHTMADMEAAAEDQGRVFRLGFLFDPFTLEIDGDCLSTPSDGKLLFVRYARA